MSALDRIDVNLLIKQKLAIVRAIMTAKGADVGLLNGVLNLLDAIHDERRPVQPVVDRHAKDKLDFS